MQFFFTQFIANLIDLELGPMQYIEKNATINEASTCGVGRT